MKLLPIALVALLALGLSLPAAIAERPMEARKARPVAERHGAELQDVSLRLNGTGIDRENATYTFSLLGKGKAMTRSPDGNVSAIRAELIVYGKLVDANGTLVKEGRFRLFLFAKQGEDGNWTWHAMSVGKIPRGLPHVMLRGTSPGIEDGALALEGKGRVAVRTDEGPLRVRLEVEGGLAKVPA